MKNFFIIVLCISSIFFTSSLNAVNLSNGDLDGDGYITQADLKILARDLNTLVASYNGDINNDNTVDKNDINTMAKLILKESGSVKGKITNELVKDFISSVTNDKKSTTENNTRTKTIKKIIKKIENNKETLKITKLRKKNIENNYSDSSNDFSTDDNSTGTSISTTTGSSTSSSSAINELRKIFNKVDNKKIDDIEGIPPEYPKEIDDYYEKLRKETSTGSLDSSTYNLDIDYINNERKATARNIDDIVKSIEGKSIEDISLSEVPDSVVLDLSFEKSGTSFQDRTSLSNKYADIPIIKGKSDFLPKTNFKLKLDPNKPENIVIFQERTKTGLPIDDDYKIVSVWNDEIPSSFVDQKYKEKSDDPFVSQILHDESGTNSFVKKADKNSDKTLTRAEVFKQLFNPKSAMMILTGQSEQMGLSKDSPLVQNYMKVLEEQEPVLVSTGAVDKGTIEEIKNVKRQLDNAIASKGGGGGGDDSSMFGGILDAITGGASSAVGVTGGSTGGTGTSTGGTGSTGSTGGLDSVPIPKPRPDDLGSSSSDSGGFDIMSILDPANIGGAIGAATGMMTGGPIGAVTGAKVGSSVGSAIGDSVSSALSGGSAASE